MPDYHKSNGASLLAGHKQEKATLTVLEWAEVLSEGWAA